jgi:hypothetical protein
MTDPDIQSFVAGVLIDFGADVSRGESVMWVRAPERLQSALGMPENFPLAFDPAHSGEFGADLVAPGSYVLERLLSLAMERGRWDATRVKAVPEDWVQRALSEVGVRWTSDSGLRLIDLRDAPYFLFTFRLTYLADEKRETFHGVAVSPEESIAWPVDPLGPDRVVETPLEFPQPPNVKDAYPIARVALREMTRAETRAFRERSLRLLEEEVRRIFRYYDETIAELREADSSNSAEVVRAIEAERGRRLAEALERFEPRATAALCAIRAIVAPTAVLEWAGVGVRRIRVDAWTKAVRGLVCGGCQATDGPWSRRGDELLCARCSVTEDGSAPPRARPRSGTPPRGTRTSRGSGRSARGSRERSRAAAHRREGP